jgi:uncharacterized protein YndB with AHSA1/START domain
MCIIVGKGAALAHYRFESEWKIGAPIEKVFDLIARPEDFAQWWPSMKTSRLVDHGDESGVGVSAEYILRSPLRYSMTFRTKATEVVRPHRIHSLVRGDLVGTGTYQLDEDDDGTRVELVWRVSTAKSWMNRLTPIARPLFVWAHHRVMREGAQAMATRLGARLFYAEMSIEDEPRPRKAVGSR